MLGICYMKHCVSLLLFSILLTGCSTTSTIDQVNKFYKPFCPDIKLKRPTNVIQEDFPHTTNSEKEIAQKKPQVEKAKNFYLDKGYLFLGHAIFTSALLNPRDVQEFAASKGGDVALFIYMPAGVETRTRMVPASYTPPSTSTTTASASAIGLGNSQSQITPMPFGSPVGGGINVSTQSNSSVYGSATSSTYNPGQITFTRESYQVQMFTQVIYVLQSPRAHLNNWDAVAAWRAANGYPASPNDVRISAQNFAAKYGLPVPEKYR